MLAIIGWFGVYSLVCVLLLSFGKMCDTLDVVLMSVAVGALFGAWHLSSTKPARVRGRVGLCVDVFVCSHKRCV